MELGPYSSLLSAPKQTQYQDPLILDRLAAAYAEAREFDKALVYLDRALQIANRGRQQRTLVPQLMRRKELYQKQEPFRMDAG